MKTMLFGAAAMLSLSVGAALAAPPPQYNVVGNPFPFRTAMTEVVAAPPAIDTGSQAYQSSAPGYTQAVIYTKVLPVTGSNGIVQSPNSLPPGFERGMVAYMQDQIVDRHLHVDAAQQ